MYRILIADDHQTIRQIVKNMLLDEFPTATVEEAPDTTVLIEQALTHNWNLIISDLVMPGGGGLFALKKIKQEKPYIPVFIISTHPPDQYSKQVIAAGAEEFISKSNIHERLIPSIYRVLHSIPQKSK